MTDVERSEIQWGKTEIPYAIRRSDRRRTVSIAVEPSGKVVLTAPSQTSVARLDRVVRQKAQWIVARAGRGRALPRPSEREFVSGETVAYLGRNYRLRVVERRQARPPRLERGWLEVTPGRQSGDEDRAKEVRHQLIEWYRARAGARLIERASWWSEKLRVPLDGVLIGDPQRRWGSCDASGTLRFNWRIIQAPQMLVDYVIVHEMVHLRHRDHSSQFWAALGKILPDYDERRTHLRLLGPMLVW